MVWLMHCTEREPGDGYTCLTLLLPWQLLLNKPAGRQKARGLVDTVSLCVQRERWVRSSKETWTTLGGH